MISVGTSFILTALMATSRTSSPQLIVHEDLTTYRLSSDGKSLSSPVIEFTTPVNDVVVSWKSSLSEKQKITISIKAIYDLQITKDYIMGIWAVSGSQWVRESINGQKDADGDVYTDTLSLKTAARKFRLSIQAEEPLQPGEVSKIYFSGLSESDSKVDEVPANKDAWGQLLILPRRCQADYPNGNVICSPTATSMVLAYWSLKLARPEIDQGVVAVCEGVYDRGWKGTGNWAFNTAYAAGFVGMDAFVTRAPSTQTLETLISLGFPVICSVSYDLLKGKEKASPNDGHLVVLVGFTRDGDPIFNDPGRRIVRMTYNRKDFVEAWERSNNTIYLIHPESKRPPLDLFSPAASSR